MPTPSPARRRHPLRRVAPLVLLLAIAPSVVRAADYTFVRRIANPIPGQSGVFPSFGEHLAVLGANGLLVASPDDDTVAENAGAVYLFDPTTGALLRTFTRPGAQAGERFGSAVAVVGGNVLIGAESANDVNFDSGVAYLFDPTTGAVLLTFQNPTVGLGGDGFGWAVAAYGSDVLVGAPFEDDAAANGGAVYLFDGTTGALVRTFTSPSPHVNEAFGSTLGSFGSTVVVGAPEAIANNGRVYELDGATGALLHTLQPAPGPYVRQFGESLAVVGTSVLAADVNPAGASPPTVVGAAALFDGPTGALVRQFTNPTQVFNSSNSFGSGLALIGNDVFVSDILDGSAHEGSVFRFDATSGALLQTIRKGLPVLGDDFGASLATLGTSLAIGAPHDRATPNDFLTGAVYVFAPCGNGVQELGQECDDGNVVDGDGCDSNCTLTACNNGVQTSGEACDDGELGSADCCSATCVPAAVGASCDDGNPGTVLDQCNASAVCEGLPPGIPTLSEWGVMLLSLLMLTRIVLLTRRQRVAERR